MEQASFAAIAVGVDESKGPLGAIGEALAVEFTDVPGLGEATLLVVRLLLAGLLGGLLGWERERSQKPAGVRTHTLVCLGTALFVVVPERYGIADDGLSRVLQGLVAGIGFLGTGTILKSHDRVQGLTTAASLWMAVAIGAAVGLGRALSAVLATAMTLLVLAFLPHFGGDKGDD